MAERAPRNLLSHFWTPLTAVGSHGPAGPNAQICVSVFGASIVPERPRLLVTLSKTNSTTQLVQASGTLAVTLLSEQQVDLLAPLGLRSGRDGQKLDGLEVALTAAGDPWFPEGVGLIDCRVIEQYDLGDAVAFLCAVREQQPSGIPGVEALTWAHARAVVGEEFLSQWAAKSEREQHAASTAMRWTP